MLDIFGEHKQQVKEFVIARNLLLDELKLRQRAYASKNIVVKHALLRLARKLAQERKGN